MLLWCAAGGVNAGDVIVAVDGKPTAGLSLYEASGLLQGPADSQVRLSGPEPEQVQPRICRVGTCVQRCQHMR